MPVRTCPVAGTCSQVTTVRRLCADYLSREGCYENTLGSSSIQITENRFKDSNQSYKRIRAQDKTGYIASPNNKRNTSLSADEYNLATRKESKKFDHGAEPE